MKARKLSQQQREYAERKLAEYDASKNKVMPSQLTGIRNDIRLATGLTITELREALREAA